MSMPVIKATWPAPSHIVTYTTTRVGGVSVEPYGSLNPATHVGDNPEYVDANRRVIAEQLCLPSEPIWLDQVHGIEIVNAEARISVPQADGSMTSLDNVVCAIQTADCLPVLFCDVAGDEVAAVHAGWRGLLNGILENTVSRFTAPASNVLVWMGPAISAAHFEVGPEVRKAFVTKFVEAEQAFTKTNKQGHYMADLYTLARICLRAVGVNAIYGGEFCTYTDSERFYSYRRDGVTGRMLSLIYRKT